MENDQEGITVTIRIKTKLFPQHEDEEEDEEFDEIKDLLGNFSLKDKKEKIQCNATLKNGKRCNNFRFSLVNDKCEKHKL